MTPAEKTRATIYALAAALFAVLAVYGLATQEQIGAWMGVVAAAIPVMALLNVPGFRNRTGEKEDDHGEAV
jgi:hypothetical protein